MAEAKLVVLYPVPKDLDEFEHLYQTEHLPLAVKHLFGQTKAVFSTMESSPAGERAFHKMVQIYFPNKEALMAWVGSPGAGDTLAHAEAISSGGRPHFLIADESVTTF